MLRNRLKSRLGIEGTDEDGKLDEVILSAKSFIVGYCRLAAYDSSYDDICVRMAAEDYCRLSSEGVERRNFSGVYESYRDGYSEPIMAMLKSMRRMAVI